MRQVWAFVLGVLGVLSAAAWVEAKEGGNPVVLMKTSMGDIKIELDKAKAPVTVENFLVYVNDKFYDGTVFHRVIPAFMIQGGGFDKDMKQKKTKAPIKNEAGNGLKNVERHDRHGAHQRSEQRHGAVLHQHQGQRVPRPQNDTAQGYGYAVFGKVVDGMDVVKKIEQVQTTTRVPYENVPVDSGDHRERARRRVGRADTNRGVASAGVIFDLDGVIVDSEPLQHQAYNLVLERFGIRVERDEYGREWIAAGRGPEYAVRTYALPVTADELRRLKDPVYHDAAARGGDADGGGARGAGAAQRRLPGGAGDQLEPHRHRLHPRPLRPAPLLHRRRHARAVRRAQAGARRLPHRRRSPAARRRSAAW